MILAIRCAEIPFAGWAKWLPNLQIPLQGHGIHHPLLENVSYGGHDDEAEKVLTRSGRMIVKLVHYSSDGPDSETRLPDEILGEADHESYLRLQPIAQEKLDWLKRRTEEDDAQCTPGRCIRIDI